MIERYEEIIKVINSDISNSKKIKKIHKICNNWKIDSLREFADNNFASNTLMTKIVNSTIQGSILNSNLTNTINGNIKLGRNLKDFLAKTGVVYGDI